MHTLYQNTDPIMAVSATIFVDELDTVVGAGQRLAQVNPAKVKNWLE